MHGKRQLDCPKIGRKVAAIDVDDLHDALANLPGQLAHLLEAECLEVVGVIHTR
jgi:hypothetical protein